MWIIHAEPDYSITHIAHSPGIYFQDLGSCKVYHDQWKLLTYVDFEDLFSRISKLYTNIFRTKQTCQSLVDKGKQIECEALDNLEININKLKNEEQILSQIVDHNPKRVKRGWINAIGKGLKTVFGTMDEDDAQFYSSKINQFAKNEESLTDIIKDQSNIVQSSIHSFNETTSKLEYNEMLLMNSTIALKLLGNSNAKHINDLTLQSKINSHVSLLNSLLSEYQFDLFNIINAVLNSQKGLIHPSVITPFKLVAELKKLQSKLPEGQSFPVDINEANAHLLQKTFKLDVYFQDLKLVYIIKIPLITHLEFTLFKLFPLPSKAMNNTFTFLQPSSEYLAINKNMQNYLPIRESQFQNCIEILSGKCFMSTHAAHING
ncbi:PREDICTED: uncharacterized protein LOC108567922 [Nicrophorus vespilloides]|uniref:Uncharacterized protein LOC108567922 n=1 Tax=Nicrophorus vespilloides TaxID=110193 RepID=A0ABM1NBL4_NICVS|nr:PREDICTED: uncharacterized protein LOC108567922 [Nicrophorus vespilloides]